jgi:hypothetical protein
MAHVWKSSSHSRKIVGPPLKIIKLHIKSWPTSGNDINGILKQFKIRLTFLSLYTPSTEGSPPLRTTSLVATVLLYIIVVCLAGKAWQAFIEEAWWLGLMKQLVPVGQHYKYLKAKSFIFLKWKTSNWINYVNENI